VQILPVTFAGAALFLLIDALWANQQKRLIAERVFSVLALSCVIRGRSVLERSGAFPVLVGHLTAAKEVFAAFVGIISGGDRNTVATSANRSDPQIRESCMSQRGLEYVRERSSSQHPRCR
jgi:hypothetical protein